MRVQPKGGKHILPHKRRLFLKGRERVWDREQQTLGVLFVAYPEQGKAWRLEEASWY